jgi:Protein of unknown function (DUF1573)
MNDMEKAATNAADIAPRSNRHLFITILFTMTSVVLTAGWGSLRSGSPRLLLPYLSGERLLITPTTLQLGNLKGSDVAEATVLFVNRTGKNVTVVGAQKSCSCIKTEELPVTVPDGGSRELHLEIHIAKRSGSFRESVKFFTDFGDLQSLSVTCVAVVR